MHEFESRKIAVASIGIFEIPAIEAFLGGRVCRAPRFLKPKNISAVAGWGTKKSGVRAEIIARRLGTPVIHLEDGFLRSVYPGRDVRPNSMVKDYEGIYYDSTRPSTLENMLNSDSNLVSGIEDDIARARQLILEYRLSKYNHAPDLDPARLRPDDRQRVLVIDQTAGDNSVTAGGANAATFGKMLAAAAAENPLATVYVKTHPEVSLGKKRGYLSDVETNDRTVMLREAINPVSLVSQMDRVYTVTSTMGFEALLAGRQVTCFGIPWYSGWGVTDDRQLCPRRRRHRSVDELFAAAYFRYTTYLNPRTEALGSIFDVIEWLAEQKMAQP